MPKYGSDLIANVARNYRNLRRAKSILYRIRQNTDLTRFFYHQLPRSALQELAGMVHSISGGRLCIRKYLLLIIPLAFVLRVAVRLHIGEHDFWENGYTFFFTLAQNIAVGHGFSHGGGIPTAFRVPLYPMFLAAVTLGYQAFLPIVVAQSLIGAGTAFCAALIARELFGNSAAIIAA